MVQDTDLLGPMILQFDNWVDGFKKGMGAYIERVVKDIFNKQGPATEDTDPLNPRGINPQWKPLSWITIQLKGSSAILIDTRQLANFVRWDIEDSEWDDIKRLAGTAPPEDKDCEQGNSEKHHVEDTGKAQKTYIESAIYLKTETHKCPQNNY